MSKPTVFISYSKHDEELKNRLVRHLGVSQQVELWDDSRIAVGGDWLKAILDAIDTGCVAVLLVSADSLTTEFILREEVPRMLAAHQAGQMWLFPIVIKPCNWQSVDWLSRLNLPFKGRPTGETKAGEFSDYQLEKDLTEIARQIGLRVSQRTAASTALAPENPPTAPSPLSAQPNHFWMILAITIVVGVCVGGIGLLLWKGVYRQQPSPSAPVQTKIKQETQSVPQSSESQLARIEFRTESAKALRDVIVRVNLNHTYSIQELGHFRILLGIGDYNATQLWLGCQDAYDFNALLKGVKAKQFGIRYSALYRSPDEKNTYTAIPAYTSAPKYTTVTSASESVDALEFGLDLFGQVPHYKILDDFDRKNLNVYVTESLIGKISEITFEANSYILTSKKTDMFKWNNEQPILDWFVPLSKAEQAISWRGLGLNDTTGQLEKLLGTSASLAWQLDFSISTPIKVLRKSLGNN